MKLKKILLVCAACVLSAVLAVGGTLAYLTFSDYAVNTMTLGEAKIDQLEKERVDMNHQDQQTPAELRDFTQDQKLFPAVNDNAGQAANDPAVWAPGQAADEAYVNYGDLVNADITGPHWTGVWDKSLKNVKDKMVFVENTGDIDVYYRTIILYEYDETEKKNSYDQGMIHFNTNGNSRFDWSYDADKAAYYTDLPETVTVNGEKYGVMVATYNIVLKPDTVSRPSLLQVGLDGDADGTVVNQFGEKYDILVLSQAVQAAGFSNAHTALNAGFGAITTQNLVEWFANVK